MRIKKINDEVLYSEEEVVKLASGDISFLEKESRKNERNRIRICSHRGVEDDLHEMIIVHAKDAYVRPHKHLGKSESLHVIKGSADAVFFDENGCVNDVIELGDFSSGKQFYYRISDPLYHSLIIKSDVFVFHEVTKGPFERRETVFAPWSPEEDDIVGQETFFSNLKKNL